ncbi:unnamed protein product [Mytilus edulis]|uniref:Uncharacterized protein n=1 Tax=Mytilus edulis TaxID=6550 RepID=A0A8S3PQ22_MYTED|nr:unnamed protein product [Mytilus edulis]
MNTDYIVTSLIFKKVTYPKEGEAILEFRDFHKQMRVPFVIYADFECFTKRWILVNQNQINRQQHIKQNLFHVVTPTRCGPVQLIDIPSQPLCTEERTQSNTFFENIFTEEEYIDDILRNIYEELIMSVEPKRNFKMLQTVMYAINHFQAK